MHYRDGREAKVGDQVVGVDSCGKAVGGVLVEATPGSDTCNGRVMPQQQIWSVPSINIKDLLHVENAFPAASIPQAQH